MGRERRKEEKDEERRKEGERENRKKCKEEYIVGH